MRGVFWYPNAWEDYVDIQQEKQLLRKINALIKDIQRNGYKCSFGKPEMLLQGGFVAILHWDGASWAFGV